MPKAIFFMEDFIFIDQRLGSRFSKGIRTTQNRPDQEGLEACNPGKVLNQTPILPVNGQFLKNLSTSTGSNLS